MNGIFTLYLDQWGNRFTANSVRELRRKIRYGKSRVSKMYRTKSDGSHVHTGYVIGGHWLSAFRPVELPA